MKNNNQVNTDLEITDALLADYERDYKNAGNYRQFARRFKPEKDTRYRLRFLPVRLTPSGKWYMEIARHWIARKPILCPRLTAVELGGDPERPCPVCDAADRMADNDAMATKQYTVFCLLLDIEGREEPWEEILKPYQIDLYAKAWQKLMFYWKNGLKRGANSIFDYQAGSDLIAVRGKNGLELDRDDPSPLFDAKDPNYRAWIKKIESGIRIPRIIMPDDKALAKFARNVGQAGDDVEDEASFQESRQRVLGQLRRSAPDEPARIAPPARRPAAAPQPEPAEDEPLPEDESNAELNPVRRR